MHRLVRRAIVLGTAGILAPAIGAQAPRPHLDVTLPAAEARATEAPLVACENMIADGAIQDRMRSGFPARLHFKLERWSAEGVLNDLEATTEWDVIVRYDALSHRYEVIRKTGDQVARIGSTDSVAGAEAMLAHPYRPSVAPPKAGRHSYYSVSLDVETMSLSDLDELEGWLKGDLRPAVRGQRNPANVLTRGLRTLMLRLLGGTRRHYQARSPTFVP